jgi:kynurenine 3-monooxygenase
LFLPFEGDISFKKLQTKAAVTAFFKQYFPDATALMPTLEEDFFANPTSSLITLQCNPWQWQGRILLLGDAAHAIVPFYGQGMNAGFEDCTILDAMYEEHHGDWSTMIPAFATRRKPDGDAIAELALRNFIEMRDLVSDPLFLLRKKIAAMLHEKHPSFLPSYSLVTFSNTPYSEAIREDDRQNAFFKAVLALEGIEENWENNVEVERLFKEWYLG